MCVRCAEELSTLALRPHLTSPATVARVHHHLTRLLGPSVPLPPSASLSPAATLTALKRYLTDLFFDECASVAADSTPGTAATRPVTDFDQVTRFGAKLVDDVQRHVADVVPPRVEGATPRDDSAGMVGQVRAHGWARSS